jgi:UDP-N-acetylmuramate dehydrogenase
MIIKQDISLLPYNTFGIDAKADYFVEYCSIEDLQTALLSEIVKLNKIFHIGGGSNLLFLNDYKGVILHSAIKFIEIINEDTDYVFIKVGSGIVWDDFVMYAVENGWCGIENLSLIPGEVGAAAVQNIGAYGVEVQDSIVKVNAVEISTALQKTFSVADCNYGYRESIFKNELNTKYIITSVEFRLKKKPIFKLNYQHLEEEVLKSGEVNLKNIRSTIIDIRKSKLPDTNVFGNAGSFFMNPVITKELFNELQNQYPQIPHYFVSDAEEKVPAGWLIDQCGWKGKQLGNAAVHDKQALVLINKGGAKGQEIVYLAQQIQASVKSKFGIELHAEVNYI